VLGLRPVGTAEPAAALSPLSSRTNPSGIARRNEEPARLAEAPSEAEGEVEEIPIISRLSIKRAIPREGEPNQLTLLRNREAVPLSDRPQLLPLDPPTPIRHENSSSVPPITI
jgi:hypothetical protein